MILFIVPVIITMIVMYAINVPIITDSIGWFVIILMLFGFSMITLT